MCGCDKPIEEFANAGIVEGIQYFRWKCIPCYYKFKQIRKHKIRDEYYELKKQLKCCHCGNNDFRVLDFDHLDRDKKSLNVSEAMKRGCALETIKEEIKKCQVLCANCHRIKTYEENQSIG